MKDHKSIIIRATFHLICLSMFLTGGGDGIHPLPFLNLQKKPNRDRVKEIMKMLTSICGLAVLNMRGNGFFGINILRP